MDPTRTPRSHDSHEKEKGASLDDNNLELSLCPPGERKCSTDTQKRSSPRPVVGWPPVGSFRKNLAINKHVVSSPPPPNTLIIEETKNMEPETQLSINEHLFVKVYMEGFPIGRKVDLRAYDSYKKLSVAMDELFGGLVAVGRSHKVTTAAEHDAADGYTEYTLVYEDNEGDRILAGDVPWIMFASTAKKLHLIRSSQSTLG